LWQHLAQTAPAPPPAQPDQQQNPADCVLKLEISSCRLLLAAAAETCSTQQQLNQLQVLFQAVVPMFPNFELQDFRQLLQLCAQARFMPDKDWLACVYYADTGGLERLYKEVGLHPLSRVQQAEQQHLLSKLLFCCQTFTLSRPAQPPRSS
jgi:hypothetical protein